MKAITTKYHGPTDFKGGRIRASDGDGNSRTIGYDHRYDSEKNHASAAADLIAKMDWQGVWVGAHVLKGGKNDRMVWVCTSDKGVPSLTAVKTSKGFEVHIDAGK